MSSTTSNFTVMSGLPPVGKSAMIFDYPQKSGESPVLSAGMIAKLEPAAVTGLPVATKLTSGNVSAVAAPDYPWLVIRGYDQYDSQVDNKLTLLALKSGAVWRVDVASAAGFTIGDLVYSNAGVVTKVNATQQAVGHVIEVDTATNILTIASGNRQL